MTVERVRRLEKLLDSCEGEGLTIHVLGPDETAPLGVRVIHAPFSMPAEMWEVTPTGSEQTTRASDSSPTEG